MAKRSRSTSSSGSSLGSGHVLRIALAEIRPPIWRELLLPSDTPLSTLHDAIQAAFPWTDSHLHAFHVGRARLEDAASDPDASRADERRFTVADVLPRVGMKIRYEYDFGDSWIHEVRVKEIRPAAAVGAIRCLDGARACPPEDCGGAAGYEELLLALAHPNHARHEELKEWLGDSFDAEAFALDRANRALSRIGKQRRRP